MKRPMAASPKLTPDSSPSGQQSGLPEIENLPVMETAPLGEINTAVPLPHPQVPADLLERARSESASWDAREISDDWPTLRREFREARKTLEAAFDERKGKGSLSTFSPNLRDELLTNRLLIQAVIQDVEGTLSTPGPIPQVQVAGQQVPRVYLATKTYLSAVHYQFDEDSFRSFFSHVQQTRIFDIAEVQLLASMLQFQLLLELSSAVAAARSTTDDSALFSRVQTVCASFATMRFVDWKATFIALSATEKILSEDPCGAYPRTDFISSNAYREAIQELSRFSDSSECDVARAAISLAQSGLQRFPAGSRSSQRHGHVGYYLVAAGRPQLERQIRYNPQGIAFIRSVLLEAPELFYFLGIEFCIFAIMIFLLSGINVGIPFVAATLALPAPLQRDRRRIHSPVPHVPASSALRSTPRFFQGHSR